MKTIENSYLLIDNSILNANIRQLLKELSPGCSLIPVLKDNAYELGLVNMGKIISSYEEIEMIAVAHISEGLMLRENGFKKKILVMGNPVPHLIRNALDAELELSISRLGLIPQLDGKASIQVEINSGLNRTGISPAQLNSLVSELKSASNEITVTGIYSHFSSSDPIECEKQFNCFLNCIERLESEGFKFPTKHISSSASFECFPQYNLDAVRIGRRLYMDAPGVYDGNIREAASWRTFITGMYEYKEGEPIGYGAKNRLKKDSVLAVIGVGYGDGLNPMLAEVNAPVLVGGKRCPLMACFMDQAIIDVTCTECQPGDEVTLFGYDENGILLPSQEIALLIGDNEGCGLTSDISERVEKIYI